MATKCVYIPKRTALPVNLLLYFLYIYIPNLWPIIWCFQQSFEHPRKSHHRFLLISWQPRKFSFKINLICACHRRAQYPISSLKLFADKTDTDIWTRLLMLIKNKSHYTHFHPFSMGTGKKVNKFFKTAAHAAATVRKERRGKPRGEYLCAACGFYRARRKKPI